MKKFLSFVLLLVVVLGLVACGSEKSADVKDSKDNDYITINTSNCNYYLSIDDSLISTTDYGYGPVGKAYSRKVIVNGAVNGIYSDCVLTFEYTSNGESKQISVQLNAAGFASFTYGYFNGKSANIVSCTGKLYI